MTVAIISGRQRSELQKYIGIRKMKYMGLYGWENKDNSGSLSQSAKRWFARSSSLLAELPAYPGVWIEPKRNSFSVHLLGATAETQRQMRSRGEEARNAHA